MSKRTGFNRSRNYYKWRDQKRKCIQEISALKKSIRLMEVTHLLCTPARPDQHACQISRFSAVLKKNFNRSFQMFVYQFLENSAQLLPHLKKVKNQKKLGHQFEQFFVVRTGNLPNVHILFWLNQIDLHVILNNFLDFLKWNKKESFEEQLEKLDNKGFFQTERGLTRLYRPKRGGARVYQQRYLPARQKQGKCPRLSEVPARSRHLQQARASPQAFVDKAFSRVSA